MQRRVPPGDHEIAGVTLKVSTMGGYAVERDGEYLGWIHASIADQWNAYVRRPGTTGDFLGALRAAAGRTGHRERLGLRSDAAERVSVVK